jgi:hypothetical protein
MAGYIGSKTVNLSTTGADIAGDADVSGTLDVGGAFTSQGIDDNATSTAMTLDGSGNVGVGAVPLTSGNIPDLTIAHTGHGLGLGYQGATLPTAAGMYTSNSTNFGQAYGSLVVQSRTDYSGYSITFRNNGGERMRIDSAGRVTTPYQPTFHATRTSHVTGSGDIVFTGVNLNVGSHYSSTNGRFTAPIAGSYIFAFSTLLYNMGNASNAALYVNGSVKYNMSSLGTYGSFSGTYAGQGGTVIVGLNAGDYATVNFTHAGTNLHANYTYWSGMLLG